MENKDRNKKRLKIIAGAGIGAILGSLSVKREDVILGSLLGATISASFSTNRSKVPTMIVENNELIKIYADGRRELVRKINETETTGIQTKFVIQ